MPHEPAMEGKALTDRPRHGGLFRRSLDEAELGAAAFEQAHPQLLEVLVGLQSIADAMQRAVGVPRQRVMYSGSAQIGANGTWTWNGRGAESAAIFVINFSTSTEITVVAQAPQGVAPGPGAGTHNLPAGAAAVFNDLTPVWTIYGSAGNVVDVQIFGIPIQPMAAGQI